MSRPWTEMDAKFVYLHITCTELQLGMN